MKMRKMLFGFATVAMIFAFSTTPVLADATATASSAANSTSIANPVGVGQQGQQQQTDVNIRFPDPPAEQTINNTGRGYRGFPEAANINYPGQPGYFGPVNQKTPRYTPVETLTLFNNSFTADQLEKMDTSGWRGIDPIVSPMVDVVADDQRAGAITVYAAKPEGKVQQLGFATFMAGSNKVNSQVVLAAAAKEALKYGANAIYVTGEGAELVLKASGWGIGINTTVASLSSSEATGTVAGGGTGYSSGEAGYKDRPWLQIFILTVN